MHRRLLGLLFGHAWQHGPVGSAEREDELVCGRRKVGKDFAALQRRKCIKLSPPCFRRRPGINFDRIMFLFS
jgi:hypothetical protein